MECRVCKSKDMREILSLGNQYLSEFRKDSLKPPCYPLDLVICIDCSQMQLRESTPASLLYTDNYGYRSGVNSTMRDHLKDLATEVCELVDLSEKDVVIDVGSNDGTLLKFFPNWTRRLGFDLVGKFSLDYKGTGIEFYNSTLPSFSYKAKVITVISMFYDLESPYDFLSTVVSNLSTEGIVVIQQNYLLSMLKQISFDNICHEHIFYHSFTTMENLVKPHGLQIFRVSINSLNGGSFRIYLCRTGVRSVESSVEKIRLEELAQEADLTSQFSKKVDSSCKLLYSFVKDVTSKGKTIYLYGASTRVNTLLQYCKLGPELISKAVERNPEKYGMKIASVGIPIISENQARAEKPDYMLVGPYFFRNEFIKREAEYLGSGGRLIFPLPILEVV